jgi:pimeloyl-ACP methyl ester carboxylesterase
MAIERYSLYVHDYGAQVGCQLALRSPDKVRALVIQNSEAYYEDGRSPNWSAMEEYWRDPGPAKREALRNHLFTEEGIRREFMEDLSPDVQELIDPGVITLAWAQINRAGVIDALLDLHLDYRSNVELYPRFQAYFRNHQPPILVIWGKDDQYYSPAAAMAYKRDLPYAEIQIIDGGHWALESHGPEIIQLTRRFFNECYAESVAA